MTWDLYGLPFSLHQSSCSNRKPKMFSWDEDVDLDVELWVDHSIEHGLTIPKKRAKKYAWLCESRSIVPFFSKLYSLDGEGNMFVDGITPTLQKMIDEFDIIFTCDKDLINLHDKIQFCFAGSTLPWIDKENQGMRWKNNLCSFVSSDKNMCKGHQKRHELYKRIREEYKDGKPTTTHVYGSITGKPFGRNVGCHLKEGGNWHDKIEAFDTFSYSIVLENDVYPSYFTEKLTDCFVTATVPIYWGAPDIDEYFSPMGIIKVNSIDEIMGVIKNINDMNNRKDYLLRIDAIKENFQRVGYLKSPDDMLYCKIFNDIKSYKEITV